MFRRVVCSNLLRSQSIPQHNSSFSKNVCCTFSSFRTTETNPANFDESHLGRYYTMDPETYNQVFTSTDKGGGLPSFFKVQCRTFREAAFMVRKPFLDIKRCIEAYDLSLPVLRYILFGAFGNGKTLTMGTLAHYGHVKGYVLVHVPLCLTFTAYTQEIVPSIIRSGWMDHTLDSVVWLSYFRHQNSKILAESKLKTSREYKFNERENVPAGSDFSEIIAHGIARPIHAAECIYAIITELKIFSSQGKIKTMVLIDGVNAFYNDAPYMKRPDKTLVPYREVTVFNAFKEAFKTDWTGGVVITTVDQHQIQTKQRQSDYPRALLNKDGWEAFDPFVPIHVEKYTSQEVQTTIDYYLDRKWLQHPRAGTPEARLELETLCLKNPFELMQLSNSR